MRFFSGVRLINWDKSLFALELLRSTELFCPSNSLIEVTQKDRLKWMHHKEFPLTYLLITRGFNNC